MSTKTYQKGEVLDLVLPKDRVSGSTTRVGSFVGVVQETGLSGETRAVAVEGVHRVPKLTTDVVAIGDKANYNGTTDEFQAATSDVDGAATVLEAAGNGVTEMLVKLTPQ